MRKIEKWHRLYLHVCRVCDRVDVKIHAMMQDFTLTLRVQTFSGG